MQSNMFKSKATRVSSGAGRTVRGKAALLLAVAGSAGAAGTAWAQNAVFVYTGPEGTQTAPVSGDWATGTNWLSGTAPTSGATELDFGGSGAGAYTSVNDIGAGTFGLNVMNLNSGSTATEILSANTAANSLTFNGTTPSIVQYNSGAFNLSAPLVMSGSLTVTGTGAGAVTLSGPISGAGPLVFNNAAGSLNVTGVNSYSGATNVVSGTVNFTGAASSTGTTIDVGIAAGGTASAATVNINTTGALYFNTGFNIGDLGASGAVTQTAGIVQTITSGGAYMEIGNGGYGSYTLAGGNLSSGTTTNLQGFRIGGDPAYTATANGVPTVGIYTQTGGNMYSGRYFVLGAGNGSSGSVGTFTGGTQLVNAGYRVLLGDQPGSTGVLNLGTEAGGNAVFTAGASGSGGLILRDASASTAATVNFNSGTMIFPGTIGIIGGTAGNTVLNLNGAVLQSGTSTSTILSGAVALPVQVYNGGVGFNVSNTSAPATVSANLSTATGNGIYVPGGTIPVPAGSGGSGYIGSPLVTITSSNGITGTATATAIANVSNGTITGLTLTNPGQGYATGTTLSFAFLGGSPTVAAPTFTYTTLATGDPYLAANGTGGLTKTGPGTLYLTGTNTYGGVTNVQAGILEPATTAAAPWLYYPAALNVASGATIALPIGGTNQFSTGSIAATLQLETFAAGSFLGIDTTGATTAAAGTISYGITGPEGLVKLGSNTLYLASSGTYTGVTNVSAGTLNFVQGGLGTGNVLINGGTLQYAAGTATPDDLTTGRTLTIGSGGGFLDVNGNNLTYAGSILGGTGGLTITSAAGGGSLTLGGSFNPASTLAISGGVTVVLNSPSSSISAFTGTNASIWVGQTTNGTLNVANGAFVAANNLLAVGRNGGVGVVNLGAGGTIADSALSATGTYVAIGTSGTTASGTVNQSGGVFDATTTFMAIGDTATGYYNISGGSTNLGAVVIGRTTGANGTLNLNGGVFAATSIAGGGATGTVNFNGGTLRANGSASSNFLSNVNTYVQAGGGIIDTNGQNITIYTALQTGNGNDGGLTKIGAGTLTLSGNGNYTGGTNISAGTVTAANSTALGTGPVTLTGGTLSLTSPQLAGFNSFTLNTGNTAVAGPSKDTSGQVLTLSTNAAQQANSSFSPAEVNAAGGFTASFTYTPSANKGADGIAFVVENDPRGSAAVGGAGGALGVGNGSAGTVTDAPIADSLDIELNIYGTQTVGSKIATNGTVTTPFTASTPVALGSGDPINVVVGYNASNTTVTETLTDSLTGATYSTSAVVNLSTILNGNTGYVGFTGGTGGLTATQQVSSFTYNNGTVLPVAISNPVVAAAGLTSTISVGVSNGATGSAVGAITVNPDATLNLSSSGTLTAPRTVLTTPSVTFNTGSGTTYTGQFNIAKNDLDITGQSLSAVTAYVAAGYNLAGGGNWNGPGITSSAAATDSTHLTAVGVISNSGNGAGQLYGTGGTLGTFDGTNPGANDVLVKYTYFGDANLDGKVDGSDYSLIDNGYSTDKSYLAANPGATAPLTGWYNGDFNYDGVIDGSDYALIDNAFNNQTGSQVVSTSALVAAGAAQAAPAAVPEPAIAGVIVALTFRSLARRRRRQAC